MRQQPDKNLSRNLVPGTPALPSKMVSVTFVLPGYKPPKNYIRMTHIENHRKSLRKGIVRRFYNAQY
jgi:hypothetical protein